MKRLATGYWSTLIYTEEGPYGRSIWGSAQIPVSETEVMTISGNKKPIEELKVGDIIINPEGHQLKIRGIDD